MATNSPNENSPAGDDSTGVLNEVTQKTGVPREPLRATLPKGVMPEDLVQYIHTFPEYPDEIVLEITEQDNAIATIILARRMSVDRCGVCPTAQALIRTFKLEVPDMLLLKVRRAYTIMPGGQAYTHPMKLMYAIRDYDNNEKIIIGTYTLRKALNVIDGEAEPWNDANEDEDDD